MTNVVDFPKMSSIGGGCASKAAKAGRRADEEESVRLATNSGAL
jgi:hypothetical protein